MRPQSPCSVRHQQLRADSAFRRRIQKRQSGNAAVYRDWDASTPNRSIRMECSRSLLERRLFRLLLRLIRRTFHLKVGQRLPRDSVRREASAWKGMPSSDRLQSRQVRWATRVGRRATCREIANVARRLCCRSRSTGSRHVTSPASGVRPANTAAGREKRRQREKRRGAGWDSSTRALTRAPLRRSSCSASRTTALSTLCLRVTIQTIAAMKSRCSSNLIAFTLRNN